MTNRKGVSSLCLQCSLLPFGQSIAQAALPFPPGRHSPTLSPRAAFSEVGTKPTLSPRAAFSTGPSVLKNKKSFTSKCCVNKLVYKDTGSRAKNRAG